MTQTAQQYQSWLERGHDLAWAGDWRTAAEAYQRALTLKNDDPIAYISLGLALFELGNFNEALTAYQYALHLSPGEVAALQKVAEIYALRREPQQAAATFLKLAEAHMKGRQPAQAVTAWQQVVRHDPTNRNAYRRLADAYQRGKRNDLAAQALLGLARVHGEADDNANALKYVREAVALKPDMVAAQHYLALLEVPGTGPLRVKRGTGMLQTHPLNSDVLGLQSDDAPASTGSASDYAKQRALERIASGFFDDAGDNQNLLTLKARAITLQNEGYIEEATRVFEEVTQQGGGSDDVTFALGTLYQQLLRWDKAIVAFEQVVDNPDYVTTAHVELGRSYQQQGRVDEALGHFLEAVKVTDLQSVQRNQADEVIALYEGVVDSFDAKGDQGQAELFMTQLADFLSSRGWEDKLQELRTRLGGTSADAVTMVELLESDDTEPMLAAMAAATHYQERGHLRAAIDELYWGLSYAPHYLPLHLLLADLFLAIQRPDEAVAKLVTIAEVYLTRANPTQAIRALRRAIEISPIDQNIRTRLIDLLIAHGDVDEAMGHYVQLAEGFYQLAQVERAIEKLNEALRIAPRSTPELEWKPRILRRLADIHMQRLDWRRAVTALESYSAIRPDDLDVAQELTNLYFKLGAEDRAMALFEDSSQRLRDALGGAALLRYLQQQLTMHPDNVHLIKLLGGCYVEEGQKETAAKCWEKAVEIVVRRGERTHGAAMLRRMIALRTPQEGRYRTMLERLQR